MAIRDRLFNTTATIDEETAARLAAPVAKRYSIQVRPPSHQKIPATLNRFTRNIKEPQTKWFKLRNISPVISYEILRPNPDTLRFQYVVPSKRMERKVRTQLSEEIRGVELDTGNLQLPITEDDEIGGGFLSVGRDDWHPLRTDFDKPPMNSIAASLHKHAMRDTRFMIQILFKANVGRQPRRWWWNKGAYRHRNYLRKEKENLWGTISPTPRENHQAKQIEDKAGQLRYTTSIRILVMGSGDYTKSRLKEVAAGFNVFERADSSQYLNIETVQTLWEDRINHFADAIRRREFGSWSRGFQTTEDELAGLVSLPESRQDNISTAAP